MSRSTDKYNKILLLPGCYFRIYRERERKMNASWRKLTALDAGKIPDKFQYSN
jgi:hypothetical protein